MEFTSPHRCSSGTSEQFSRGDCWVLVGDLGHLEGWEGSLHNLVGCGGEGGGEEGWR